MKHDITYSEWLFHLYSLNIDGRYLIAIRQINGVSSCANVLAKANETVEWLKAYPEYANCLKTSKLGESVK